MNEVALYRKYRPKSFEETMGQDHIVEVLKSSIEGKKISFVINLSKTENNKERIITDGFRIRRAAVDNQIPLFTDLQLARAFVKALSRYQIENLEIRSYKEYLENNF